MKIANISRRRLLLGLGLAGAMGVVGIGRILTGTENEFIENILKTHIGDMKLENGALSSCAQKYLQKADLEEKEKIQKLTRISRIVGVKNVDSLLDKWAPYDNFRRRLVTYFLMNSSYFVENSKNVPVEFFEHNNVCGNPFARFD